MHKTQLFEAHIEINGIDESGMLLKIADTLYNQSKVNVSALNISGKDGIFHATLTVYVHDVDETRLICQALKKIPKVLKAVRCD